MTTEKYPRHDRTHFYKYTSARTAKTILQKKTFRYSSPILFNDPFDVQTELLFDFDISILPKLVIEEIERVVLSKTDIPINEHQGWGQAVAMLRDKVKKHGYKKAEIRALLEPIIKVLGDLLENTRRNYNRVWKDFLPRLRVFSISEVKDSVLMWSHYADYHTGVVFELGVLPDIDNPLCVADPIVYVHKPPVFHTAEEWINEILGSEMIDQNKLYWQYARAKGDIWSYEREWRVWDLLPEAKSNLYSDYPLKDKELQQVYFGCRIKEQDKAEIISLSKNVNSQVLFFQAKKLSDIYGLEFVEI